jgi:hypothetical protein
MSDTLVHVYAADITKAERDADGALMVYGKATGPDLDLDGQICDPDWLRTAMPAWMKWGNVREMHQPIAAGVGVELAEQGDDWWLLSQCVDDGTAKKIDAGALKGYSIGIKNPQIVVDTSAPGGRIVGGAIVEVSYVDRPCNPTALTQIAKSASGTDATLVPVEAADAVTTPQSVLAAVKELLPDLDKDAPAADIATAQEALAVIARLIVSEAEGLAAGDLSEACDIQGLLDAVNALRWFMYNEREEAAQATTVVLDAAPDLTKTAPADEPTPETPPADEPAEEKTALADLVKAAVTEAMSAHEERTKALEAELAKVRATPIPGGPVLARPAQDITKADNRGALLAKAAAHEAQAAQIRATDPNAAHGYQLLADQQRAAAAAL